jgi:hypothetical protein
MNMRWIVVLLFPLVLSGLRLKAQNDSIAYHTDLYFLTSNQPFQPHWQVSNKYGIFDRNEQTELVGLFGLSYQHRFGKKFKIETEVEFNVKSNISTSYFQQIFLNVHYGSLQLKIGKEEYTTGQYSDELSSGSLFVSNNARPIPKLGIGFYEYTPFPWVGKYLEFKGAINYARLNDDRTVYNGTDDPWYHEKFFYVRTSFLPVNLHGGLSHSVLFGGTRSNGVEIEADWIASFFGKGSDKVGGGEAINAAGAHFGLYDFGLDWKINKASFQFYYQIPFADGSSMQFYNNGDQLAGLVVDFEDGKWITSMNYEYTNQMDQSGNGIPDYVLDGELVDLLKIEDVDAFMLEQFDTVTVGFTNRQLKAYAEKVLDYGYQYGGRDDYYNNGLYPLGQSYHQYSIGPSLILSKRDMKGINPNFSGQYDLFFVSNRIEAHHLAFMGYFSKDLSYRTKLTYTNNFGSYAGANKGRQNWASKEDPEYYNSYYFKDGLKQAYTFFEINYSPFKDKGAQFTSSIAYDFGEMYHNFGILFGFHYNGFFRLKGVKTN